jgi:uncharacterized protein
MPSGEGRAALRRVIRRFAAVCLLATAPLAGQPATDASIRELFEVTNIRPAIENMVKGVDATLQKTFEQALQRSQSADAEAIAKEAFEKMRAILRDDLSWERLEPMQMRIYRESLTEEEIRGMIEFYRTPAGVALMKKLPTVMQKSLGEMQGFTREVNQKVQAVLRETMEKLKSQAERDKKATDAAFAVMPSDGNVCIKLLSLSTFSSPRAPAAERQFQVKECRYYVDEGLLARLPAFDPRTGDHALPVQKAIEAAYTGYFSKHEIPPDDYYRMVEISLQKVDDFTASSVAKDLQSKPAEVRNVWFYLVKCDWPKMRRMEPAPTPVAVLMNGDVVVAREELKPMPGSPAPKATASTTSSPAAAPRAASTERASLAPRMERPPLTLSVDAKDKGKDLRERLSVAAKLARWEIPPDTLDQLLAPGLGERLDKLEGNPETAENAKAVRQALQTLTDKVVSSGRLWDELAQRYATHFTQEELTELLEAAQKPPRKNARRRGPICRW